MKIKEFLLSTGNASLMRLGVFIVLITGCSLAIVLSLIDAIQNHFANILNIGIFIGGILGLAFGAKVFQKKDEVKYESTPEQN